MRKKEMGSPFIHPTAIVHPEATIGSDTRIGAYSIIDKNVSIGKECDIQEHVVIRNFTTLGDQVRVHSHAILGGDPQHTKYRGEPTTLEIGNRVLIREFVSAHRGTKVGCGYTRIGDDSFIMGYCHIAHDCLIGKSVIFANEVQLAGHVEVGDFVNIGGKTGIGQFIRIGDHAFVGAASGVGKDIPPYTIGIGLPFQVRGVNTIGLSRRGFSEDSISRIKKVYKIYFRQGLTTEQAEKAASEQFGEQEDIRLFINFVNASKPGIAR